MRDLSELREEIDQIDRKLVELYQARMQITSEVAAYKIAHNRPVFDRDREISKLETLSAYGSTPFHKQGIKELFEQIMSISRRRQYQLLNESGRGEQIDYTQIAAHDYQGAKIVYQGMEGAYAQQALQEYFGEYAGNSYHVETWRDAMEAIGNGEADYAVLPIENSSAGIISENYDLLTEYDNCIVGEQIIKVDHALLALPGARLSDITDVYSHPQALMQCSKYLETNKSWERHSLKNTAVAARSVQEKADIHRAAIASRLTAELYGLAVLDTAIQNNRTNATRFIIVAKGHVFTPDAGKISLSFEVAHETGSLYHMLSHFIYNGLNLNHIESRPVQGKTWEYRFFVDFEGNLGDAAVQNALRGLKEEALCVQILGNY